MELGNYSPIEDTGFKIEILHYNIKYSIERKTSQLSVHDLYESFKGLALSMGYQEESWDRMIKELSIELE